MFESNSSTNQTVKYKNEELHDPLSLIFHLAWLSQKKLKIEFKKQSSFYVFNRKKLKEIKLIADLPEEIVLPGGVLVEAIKIKSKIIEKLRKEARKMNGINLKKFKELSQFQFNKEFLITAMRLII